MNKVCLVVAGGTAGHVLPSIEITRSLIEQGYHVHWLGHGEKMELQVQSEKITYHKVLSRSPRTKVVFNPAYWKLFFNDIKVVRALFKQIKFDFVLITGNFIGLLPGIVAKLNSVPMYLYEQNSLLGQANKILYPLSKKVFWGMYPQRRLNEGEYYTEQPLRLDVVNIVKESTLYQREKKRTLLVLGGSLGARFFNTTLIEKLALSGSLENWQIIHCVGSHGNAQQVQDEYKKYAIDAVVLGYTSDIARLYERSDAIIARAGALSLSEINYLSKYAMIIPMPKSVGDHQRYNVYSCLNHHHISYCEQEDLSPQHIVEFLDLDGTRKKLLPQDKIAQLCIRN